jgi:hypothetical protein
MAEDGLARQNLVMGVSTTLTALSGMTIRTGLRVTLADLLCSDHCWPQDILSYLATIFVLRANGMGFRGREVTFHQATTMLQVTYAIEIIYYLCVNAIKISIVFFYLRIGKLHPSKPTV